MEAVTGGRGVTEVRVSVLQEASLSMCRGPTSWARSWSGRGLPVPDAPFTARRSPSSHSWCCPAGPRLITGETRPAVWLTCQELKGVSVCSLLQAHLLILRNTACV